LAPETLTKFYRCTIESILSGCYLQRVVRSVQRITGGTLPHLQDTYSTRCHRKAKKIIKDINQPPEPRSVHPTTIQKARTVQVHQIWDRETKKQLLRPSDLRSCCPIYIDMESLVTLIIEH
jgi:hypothetical protein